MISMDSQLIDAILSVVNNDVARGFMTAFLGGLVVYFFSVKQRKSDRINKLDDSLIERRVKIYEQAEEVVHIISKWEPVRFYSKKCQALELNLNRGKIMYVHPLYKDIEAVKSLDERVMSIINHSSLIDGDLIKWMNVLHMYNENMIVLHEGIGKDYYKEFTTSAISDVDNVDFEEKMIDSIMLKYFCLLARFDISLIGEKISKSIRAFYSSKGKIKFKRDYFNLRYLGLGKFIYNLNVWKYLKDDRNIVNKIIYNCISCDADCQLAGKLNDGGDSKQNVLVSMRQLSTDEKKESLELKVGYAFIYILGTLIGTLPVLYIHLIRYILLSDFLAVEGILLGFVLAICITVFMIILKLIHRALTSLRDGRNKLSTFVFIGLVIAVVVTLYSFGAINDVAYGVTLALLMIYGSYTLLCEVFFKKTHRKISKVIAERIKKQDVADKE